MSGQTRDQRLRALWERCASPGAAEHDWTSLYRLVREVLLGCSAPELSGLPDERAAYIDEYFSEKVFLRMRPGLRGPDHCGALTVFFRRWLRDRLDKVERQAEDPLIDGDQFEGQADEAGCAAENVADLEPFLREDCGTGYEELAQSAKAFLTSLQPDKQWAWLMLRYNFCPDADERIPLVHLAQMHQIPSWHYRAGQLGINHRWDQGVDHFRDTILGRWLEEALRARLSPEQIDCIHAALQILCFQALKG